MRVAPPKILQEGSICTYASFFKNNTWINNFYNFVQMWGLLPSTVLILFTKKEVSGQILPYSWTKLEFREKMGRNPHMESNPDITLFAKKEVSVQILPSWRIFGGATLTYMNKTVKVIYCIIHEKGSICTDTSFLENFTFLPHPPY